MTSKSNYFRIEMKLENTLKYIIISLFLISFNVYSAEIKTAVKACNEAVNQRDAKTALMHADQILKESNTDYEALLCKGRALDMQGDYANALAAMELATASAGDAFSKIISYILMGKLHESNDKKAEAIESFRKSLVLCAETGNQTYSRINHHYIGNVYFEKKDFNAALDSYLVSVSLANNDNERAESFEYLAKTYSALGHHDKAIEFQLKATVMQKQAGTLTAYADSTLLLGQYFVNAKAYAHAERTYQKLAQFAKDNGGAYYEAKANYHLAEALFANGDKAGASALLTEVIQMAKKMGDQELLAEVEATKKKLNI
jgi:tetratricopeptide (TPR) repeat protein